MLKLVLKVLKLEKNNKKIQESEKNHNKLEKVCQLFKSLLIIIVSMVLFINLI